jgi:hypothetical protein
MIEPRTNTDIIRDLLSELQEREWVEVRRSKGCNCCPDTWETICTSCDAEVAGGYDPRGRWVESRDHKPGCKLAALILEAETFVRIEDQLQEERELQGVA